MPPPTVVKRLLYAYSSQGEGFGFWASDFAGLRYMPTHKTNAFSGGAHNNPNNAFPQKKQQKGPSFAKCHAFSGIFLSGRSAPFLIREFATCVARLQKKVQKKTTRYFCRVLLGLGPYKNGLVLMQFTHKPKKIPSFFSSSLWAFL